MKCPFCDATDTRVVDSRPAESGGAVRRRRECSACHNRFTTYERRDAVLVVRKRDGRVEPFSAAKVLAGLTSAVADRSVPARSLERLVRSVETFAQDHGPEVSSEDIGRVVLDGLRELDEVAYLRFASVYKEFEGIGDFEREVAALESED
jgi:transcriptional repressor NrdR